ncbi:hypothetical protein [Streptomyces sp. NPDC002785]|uniref:hypothetical protein n=1 Tax=Streptomyces sp. NPDC002785 TaxID=3154543 RepID=UPI00332C2CA7
MPLWFKSRRFSAVIIPSLALFIVIVVLGYGESIVLPGMLSSGSNRVQLMHIAPLIVTSSLSYSLTQRLVEAEILSVRKVRWFDTGLVVLTVGIAVSASFGVGEWMGSQEAIEAGRNTIFLTGLMLIAGALHAQAAPLAPIGWVFIVTFIGYRDFGRPWPWAVTLHPAGLAVTYFFCLTVFAVGLVMNYRIHRSV